MKNFVTLVYDCVQLRTYTCRFKPTNKWSDRTFPFCYDAWAGWQKGTWLVNRLAPHNWKLWLAVWRSGSVVRRINKVALRWARLVLGWVTIFGRVPPRYVTKPTRSTQPCIPPGSLNQVLALIGWGKGGNVTSAGWQVTLCDPVWHVTSRSGEAVCELLYTRYLLTYFASGQLS